MQFKWRQRLGRPECHYIERWVFDFGPFSFRLHHWFSSDDQRHYHDHPWSFITFVLKGGYTDVSPEGEQHLRRGQYVFREAEHKHTVRVDPGGCWTFLITGRESRIWGFWVGNKFRKRNKYFFIYGHHPCETKKGN